MFPIKDLCFESQTNRILSFPRGLVNRMNQEKIGKFIALMRKEQNLTQRQLAEMLGITDKSVSKWETGRSMPDNALLLELCSILKISVNELLSGERLTQEEYDGYAEKNILYLMEKQEKQKKTNKWTALGVVILLVVLLSVIILSVGVYNIPWFFDLQSLLLIVGISICVLLITGMFKDFVYGFRICYSSNKKEDREDKKDILRAYTAIRLVMITAILAGIFVAIISIVALLGKLSDVMFWGERLIIVLMSILYSVVLNLLLLPTSTKLYIMMKVMERK